MCGSTIVSERKCPSFQNGITRTWDMAPCPDSAAVLIYNRDEEKIVMNKRFRPGELREHLRDKNEESSRMGRESD